MLRHSFATTLVRGITDQRLLAIEPEFASVLGASARETSTLSPTLRSGWDGRPLAILTRTAPARASGAHIALIGHITRDELRRHTSTIELANGYLNRILIIACRRQRLLPESGHHDPLAGAGHTRLLAATLKHAQAAGDVRLDSDRRAPRRAPHNPAIFRPGRRVGHVSPRSRLQQTSP